MSKNYTSKLQELDLGRTRRREEGLIGSWDEARWPGGGSHGAGVEIEPARSRLRADGGGGGGGTGSGSEVKP